MMRPLLAVALIVFSSVFLFFKFKKMTAPPAQDLTPPAINRVEPAPFLSLDEIKRIRASTADPDPKVRWTAMELLFMLKDPESIAILLKAISDDSDPELRIKA